jgi:hypothetical protein
MSHKKEVNKTGYSIAGLVNELQDVKNQMIKDQQLNLQLISEVEQFHRKTEYMLDYLLDKHEIEQKKEIDFEEADFTKTYLHLAGAYYMNKELRVIHKVESIYKGWKFNEETSDKLAGTFVYNNLETGDEITAIGTDQATVAKSLRDQIREKSKSKIVLLS